MDPTLPTHSYWIHCQPKVTVLGHLGSGRDLADVVAADPSAVTHNNTLIIEQLGSLCLPHNSHHYHKSLPHMPEQESCHTQTGAWEICCACLIG
jgi:hypothetical protein